MVAKVQSEIELEILDSERLEQKLAEFTQILEKRRDTKWKKFQQNAIKERRAWQSHAGTGYGKIPKVETILNESKLVQRVTV